MDKLRPAVRVALVECMGVQRAERVLVVTDGPLRDIGISFFHEAGELGAEAMLIEMLPRSSHGQEPPTAVAAAMKEADVIIIPTSRSLSHTRARKEANLAGARIASMPTVTPEMLARTLSGDYQGMARWCTGYAAALSQGSVAEITTPAGTSLTLSLQGRQAIADTGRYLEPGGFGNLPAGEAFIAPVEGSAQGVMVVDGSMAGVGLLDEPIVIEIKDGRAVDIRGGTGAATLRDILKKHRAQATMVAELGLGLNPQARITGLVIEDEKVMGTVHVALGDNSTFGGTVEVDSHLDGVMLRPTLMVDKQILIRDGQPVLDIYGG
ncbi:MAG: aminopeptidase [Bacillota bacterium]